MAVLSEVDVRGLSPDRGAECAREALAALGPGDSVVLLSDADPAPVLNRLKRADPDVLMCPLDVAAGVASVELRKNDGGRTLAEVLRFEHEVLDRLIADVEWRIAQHRVHDAQARFAHFRAALERHLEEEEREVLPGFRRYSGEGDQGVAARLEDEHAVMRNLLRRISAGLQRPSGGDQEAVGTIADLRELLAPHARREEREVCDALPVEEAAKLASRLHSMRPL